MITRLLRRRTDSDAIPVDVAAPIDELRRLVDGEIDDAEYGKAIERGEDALRNGYQEDEPDATDDVAADQAAPAGSSQ